MKYSPQQQQQQRKERKSSSDVGPATPDRKSTAETPSRPKCCSISASTRARCRSVPTGGLFAWMRVFRLATTLNQVGC
ncbi:uncharacterized protein [Prorops nasuta]|uniref:uncharacterized protein n=1 Tax=Prorops nasuta TaxID=863751 RepID=UPI0034CEB5DA